MKMFSLLIVLTFCIHGSSARGLYDELEELEEFDQYVRGIPATATPQPEEFVPDCIKDILILWDNSYSVGIGAFTDRIRPFIRKLIKSPRLNVGEGGTNIGVVSFSTQAQTRLLWDVSDHRNEDDLLAQVDAMNYSLLKGDGTRTGIAFKTANELFSDKSPYNYRPKIGDVVVLFTDGEPIRRLREPDNEDSFGFKSETEMATYYAEELKKKNITVVGLAAGRESTIDKFYDDLTDWSNFVFKTELTDLDSILDKIINASCTSAGECGCGELTTKAYTKKGRDAIVEWLPPTLTCTTRQPTILETKISPNGSKPGQRLTEGLHEIIYSFTYQDGAKLRTRRCNVSIDVLGCECPPQTVNGVIGPSRTQGLASWEIPEPTCPAEPKQPIPEPNSSFTKGEHTVQYVYTHTSASNTFDITCDVNINMEACKCPPVQTFKEILRPGASKAFVTWQEPTPNCEVTLESSDSTAPDGLFTVGKHTRQYTYRHKTGFSMTCDVNIEVEGCECPTQTVNGVIGPSRTQGLASWEIPEPTCPAHPKQSIPEPQGSFTKGEHTVQYVYTHKSASNTFDITCDVNINMEACKCPPVQTFKEILRPGESKAFVTWKEPNPNCEVTLESSNSTAPDGLFTVGKHTRQYTYRHKTGFSMTCDVNIEVEACECPTQTVNGVIGPSRTQGLASWEIPEPTCPAHPKQPIPEPRGSFTKGEHTVQYVYTHKSASNTFDITCDVNINMEACKCPPVQTFKEILRPGESKAFVTWKEPTPNCEVTLESSDSTAPGGLFTFGKHTRQYIYRHETGFSMTCDVNIEVEACECPPQTVNGVIGPSRTQGLASWEIPEPTCPAEPKQPIPEPKGLFTEGEHTVQYVYTHKSASNTFDITCDVNINMEACKCPPVQTFKKTVSPGESKAFVTWQEPTPNCEVTLESSDSTAPDGLFTVGKYTRQYTYRHETGFSMTCDVNIEVEGELCRGKAINPDTEVCCCGEVHRAQRGYKCCGVEYYNTLAHECCDEKRANVVPKGERCPNVVFNKILRKIDLN